MPKIKKIITNPNKPVLVEFQNGKIRPGEEKFLESGLFVQKAPSKKIVGVSNQEMIYSGEVQDNANSGYNTFLILQNDDSRGLQLIQIDTCTVTPLLETNVNTTITTPVKTQSAADLKKQFGSKKTKRVTEQQERLAMNIENVKDHLEKSVADISVSTLPKYSLEDSESSYKPKINRDAMTKEEVYNISDLVPINILDSLESAVNEILENDDLSSYKLIPSVEKNMLALKSSSHPEGIVVDKCKILLYINYLVKFMVTPVKFITKKFEACDCSVEVDKHLKQAYMVNGMRPLSIKDKALCYTLVLLMLAMDYETDLESIAKDMRVGLKKMQEFARNLGFSPGKNKTSIVLKIPVPAPVVINSKRKRKN